MKITKNGTIIDLEGKILNENILIEGPIKDVLIQNGTIKGEIRLRALKIEGNTLPGYTEKVQKVSPNNVVIKDITFLTDGSTHQAYFGVGSTYCSIINCIFDGKSLGPLIYFSPESSSHTVKGCIFKAETGGRREVFAIDGSANNIITENLFENCKWGGIYIYRNSGEKGTVRHQKPQFNSILYNDFNLKGMMPVRLSDGSGFQGSLVKIPYGIILGSRQGDSSYSELDDEYDVGSGKSNLDFARNNSLLGNKFYGDWFNRHILNNDKKNVIA
jgi:parallel beta-helix repeat protein